jgi:Tfp pilus assembly major pilin PilA
MDTKNIIIIVLVITVIGIRIYQKYGKKNQGGSSKGESQHSSMPASSGDDEYEPYSKK